MPDQPPSQDLISQVDFTIINPVQTSDLNSGLATLQGNVSNDGNASVGFCLRTVDSALNTPVVPNAVVTPKWKLYTWIRVPFTGATDKSGIEYIWNDDAPNDATFLHWVITKFDPTTLQAAITDASNDALAALNTANTANTNASNALTQAEAAVTTANTASDGVATATAAAAAASNSATAANQLAQTANANASAAAASAAAAQTSSIQARTISNQVPGSAGQLMRSGYGATVVNEYFDRFNELVILREEQNSGTNGNADVAAAGAWYTRTLNTTKLNAGGLLTALAANAFTLAKGTYKYTVRTPLAGALAVVAHVSRIYNVTDVASVNVGQPSPTSSAVNRKEYSVIEGTLTTDGSKTYRIESFATSSGYSGLAITSGEKEVYSQIILERIGYTP